MQDVKPRSKPKPKCPREQPRLLATGKQLTGTDGLIYQVVESSTGVKRWKLLRVNSIYDDSNCNKLMSFHLHNLNNSLVYLTTDQKKTITKIRKASDDLRKLGFRVIEAPNPITNHGFYWGDYVWDYASTMYNDLYSSDIPCIVIEYRTNKEGFLQLDHDDSVKIYAHHIGLEDHMGLIKKFITNYNLSDHGVMEWSYDTGDNILFTESKY